MRRMLGSSRLCRSCRGDRKEDVGPMQGEDLSSFAGSQAALNPEPMRWHLKSACGATSIPPSGRSLAALALARRRRRRAARDAAPTASRRRASPPPAPPTSPSRSSSRKNPSKPASRSPRAADDVTADPRRARREALPNVARARSERCRQPRHRDTSQRARLPPAPAPHREPRDAACSCGIGLALDGPNTFRTGAKHRVGPSRAGRARDANRSPCAPKPKSPSARPRPRSVRSVARSVIASSASVPRVPCSRALGDATSDELRPDARDAPSSVAVADGTGMVVGIEVVDCDGCTRRVGQRGRARARGAEGQEAPHAEHRRRARRCASRSSPS